MFKKLLFLITIALVSCKQHEVEPPAPTQPCNASYNTDIKPLITTKCAISGCHGSNGLANLADYATLKERADNGNIKKYVFTLQMMPPSGATQLTDNEKAKLQCWLDNGALQN
ncbi:MAG: hypothetical protein JST82_15640 [Bacteroidetes bacterium]|nr:hypothetical protein [Bacteroidota bacterium]